MPVPCPQSPVVKYDLEAIDFGHGEPCAVEELCPQRVGEQERDVEDPDQREEPDEGLLLAARLDAIDAPFGEGFAAVVDEISAGGPAHAEEADADRLVDRELVEATGEDAPAVGRAAICVEAGADPHELEREVEQEPGGVDGDEHRGSADRGVAGAPLAHHRGGQDRAEPADADVERKHPQQRLGDVAAVGRDPAGMWSAQPPMLRLTAE